MSQNKRTTAMVVQFYKELTKLCAELQKRTEPLTMEELAGMVKEVCCNLEQFEKINLGQTGDEIIWTPREDLVRHAESIAVVKKKLLRYVPAAVKEIVYGETCTDGSVDALSEKDLAKCLEEGLALVAQYDNLIRDSSLMTVKWGPETTPEMRQQQAIQMNCLCYTLNRWLSNEL